MRTSTFFVAFLLSTTLCGLARGEAHNTSDTATDSPRLVRPPVPNDLKDAFFSGALAWKNTPQRGNHLVLKTTRAEWPLKATAKFEDALVKLAESKGRVEVEGSINQKGFLVIKDVNPEVLRGETIRVIFKNSTDARAFTEHFISSSGYFPANLIPADLENPTRPWLHTEDAEPSVTVKLTGSMVAFTRYIQRHNIPVVRAELVEKQK